MKKVLFVLVVATALTACGGASTTATSVDSTKTVDSTTTVTVDSSKMAADTSKTVVDSTKKTVVVDSTKK